MILFALAYLGGVLTILSPCILPVLPFVFSRADQPFVRSGLPLLAGMALTFALVASAATLGGGWVVQANQYGRWLALLLMAFFGLALLLPTLTEHMTRPLVALGSRLSASSGSEARVGSSLLLGVATGLLWAPCAGPILGLVLTGAALQGASAQSTLLLLAYAAGAATSLALALLVGGRVFATMKKSLGLGEWVRKGLGLAILAGVVAIGLGVDTGLLTRLSTVSTNGWEQSLLNTLGPKQPAPAPTTATNATPELMDEGDMPSLAGAVQWLNSPPLTAAGLKGKVVLVDFWTYSCINCLRALPYVKAWAAKYHDQGLVVIGAHAPEFAFERDPANVQKAVQEQGIHYPVAIDNDYALWRAFGNQYWPAHYFIDSKGIIRYHHFGEGGYDESERVIQTLLREAGSTKVGNDLVGNQGRGVELSAQADTRSPETYIGYQRSERFRPGPVVQDKTATYHAPTQLALNDWGLGGQWAIGAERGVLSGGHGQIVYRFHARDLHLVLGPSSGNGKPVHFKVTMDGQAPGAAHGTDINANGEGVVTEERLYQLLRVPGPAADHTFAIEFDTPGVAAYSFTFG